MAPVDRGRISHPGYKWYVLSVLLVVFALNFVDRQIIAVLAPFIMRDWGVSDSQIGLLYGTGFAVFYSIFGIPLSKCADASSRKWTLCLGLAIWSAATAVSGLATTFGHLLLARLAVGVAESSSQPAAVSMVSDYFPQELRSTALGIYMFGMYLGWGCSLIVGGAVVDAWGESSRLAGWQVAFFAVGIPGIIVSMVVASTVREPQRVGATLGAARESLRTAIAAEFESLLCPWRVTGVAGVTDDGQRSRLARRCAVRAGVIVSAAALASMLESRFMAAGVVTFGAVSLSTATLQWSIVAAGFFLALNWADSLRVRNPLAHRLLISGRAFRSLTLASGLLGVFTYSIGAFAFTYGARYVGLDASDGPVLGLVSIAAGAIGMLAGGALADLARRRHRSGRVAVVFVAIALFALAAVFQFTATDATAFYVAHFLTLMLLTCWPPILMATGQDLAASEVRGMAVAYQTLATALIGLGLGPYLVGVVSAASGSLRVALLSTLMLVPVVLVLLWRCASQLPGDETRVPVAS